MTSSRSNCFQTRTWAAIFKLFFPLHSLAKASVSRHPAKADYSKRCMMSCGRSSAGRNPCEQVSRKLFFPVAVSSAVCLLSRHTKKISFRQHPPVFFSFSFFFSDGNPPDKGVCLWLTRRCLLTSAPSVTDPAVCVEKEEGRRAVGWKRGSEGSWRWEGGGGGGVYRTTICRRETICIELKKCSFMSRKKVGLSLEFSMTSSRSRQGDGVGLSETQRPDRRWTSLGQADTPAFDFFFFLIPTS